MLRKQKHTHQIVELQSNWAKCECVCGICMQERDSDYDLPKCLFVWKRLPRLIWKDDWDNYHIQAMANKSLTGIWLKEAVLQPRLKHTHTHTHEYANIRVFRWNRCCTCSFVWRKSFINLVYNRFILLKDASPTLHLITILPRPAAWICKLQAHFEYQWALVQTNDCLVARKLIDDHFWEQKPKFINQMGQHAHTLTHRLTSKFTQVWSQKVKKSAYLLGTPPFQHYTHQPAPAPFPVGWTPEKPFNSTWNRFLHLLSCPSLSLSLVDSTASLSLHSFLVLNNFRTIRSRHEQS